MYWRIYVDTNVMGELFDWTLSCIQVKMDYKMLYVTF